jgi:glycine betaine/proline transport system permease protein
MAVQAPQRQVDPELAAERPPVVIHQGSSRWRNRILWAIGIAVAIVVGLQLTAGFPERWVIDFSRVFSSWENWVIDNHDTNWLFVHVLNPLKDTINSSWKQIVQFMSRMTWFGVVTAAAAVAAVVAGWRMAILAAVGFFLMGMLGLWESSLQTVALIIVSVPIALVIGIPLGIWGGRNARVERLLRPLMDAMQTIPAFSYLIPLVLLFSIGVTTAVISTVIFALPPAIRLTSLGIRGVPETTMEVGRAYGATERQVLRKVQLPLAKPSIMLGVNQTIMMAIGMVVIAAVVGVPGLGRDVLNALQSLNVGAAFNAGLAIVILAIVLDRVTYGWSFRDRRRRGRGTTLFGRSVPAWLPWVLAALVIAVAVGIGRQVLRQQDFPSSLVPTVNVDGHPTFVVEAWANSVSDWITTTFSGITAWVTDVMVKRLLDPLYNVLTGVPWWMVSGGAAVLAWRVSRRWGLVVMSFACITAIGVLGMWDPAMNTLSQVIVAVVLSILIAIPLGIWSARSDAVQRGMKPILDMMQTMPQFVYLVPVVALFAVGRVPAVIAAFVYALPPCVRLTDLGIRQVPNDTVEAALAYGATPRQLLSKVQLPLARPSILLGINQTIMMVLSVVIIGALVGGSGLGLEVYRGLTHDELAQGMIGGICILLLAIVIDRITQASGMAQRTMRGPVGGSLGFWTKVRAIRVRTGDGSMQEGSMQEGKGDA